MLKVTQFSSGRREQDFVFDRCQLAVIRFDSLIETDSSQHIYPNVIAANLVLNACSSLQSHAYKGMLLYLLCLFLKIIVTVVINYASIELNLYCQPIQNVMAFVFTSGSTYFTHSKNYEYFYMGHLPNLNKTEVLH